MLNTEIELLSPHYISTEEELEYITSTIKEEFGYITSTISKQIEDIIELYHTEIDLHPELPNPENHFDKISIELNVNRCFVEYVFEIQFKFLVSKGLVFKIGEEPHNLPQ